MILVYNYQSVSADFEASGDFDEWSASFSCLNSSGAAVNIGSATISFWLYKHGGRKQIVNATILSGNATGTFWAILPQSVLQPLSGLYRYELQMTLGGVQYELATGKFIIAPSSTASVPVFRGASASGNGARGFVPAPQVADYASGDVLCADGTWGQPGNAVALTDAATIAWDLNAAPNAVITLGGNRTMGAPVNMAAGKRYTLRVLQDATGSRTITWNSAFKWAGGSAPTLTTAANATDVLEFFCDGTRMLGVPHLAFA
jgi:hypothetical protein